MAPPRGGGARNACPLVKNSSGRGILPEHSRRPLPQNAASHVYAALCKFAFPVGGDRSFIESGKRLHIPAACTEEQR